MLSIVSWHFVNHFDTKRQPICNNIIIHWALRSCSPLWKIWKISHNGNKPRKVHVKMAWTVFRLYVIRVFQSLQGGISNTKTDSRLYYERSTTYRKPHQGRTCPTAAEHRLARPADGLLKTEPLPATRAQLPRHRPASEDQPHPPPRFLPQLHRIHWQSVLICKNTNFSRDIAY